MAFQRYANFWYPSTGWNGKDFSGPVKLIGGCGNDSYISFDGRWSLERCAAEARRVCQVRGHNGFTIHSGPMNRESDRTLRALEVIKPLPAA